MCRTRKDVEMNRPMSPNIRAPWLPTSSCLGLSVEGLWSCVLPGLGSDLAEWGSGWAESIERGLQVHCLHRVTFHP